MANNFWRGQDSTGREVIASLVTEARGFVAADMRLPAIVFRARKEWKADPFDGFREARVEAINRQRIRYGKRVLLDAMLDKGGEGAADVALALAGKLGIELPKPPDFANSSDEQLIVELAKRGYVGPLNERPVELRLTEDEILSLMRLEPKVPPYNRALTQAPRMLTVPELADETRRWAYNTARRCPHCNDLPYEGRTFACPECGIDRHGVGHGAG